MEERLEQKIVYMQVWAYDLCLNIRLWLQQRFETSFSVLSFFFYDAFYTVHSQYHPQSQSKDDLKKIQTLQDTWCLHFEFRPAFYCSLSTSLWCIHIRIHSKKTKTFQTLQDT